MAFRSSRWVRIFSMFQNHSVNEKYNKDCSTYSYRSLSMSPRVSCELVRLCGEDDRDPGTLYDVCSGRMRRCRTRCVHQPSTSTVGICLCNLATPLTYLILLVSLKFIRAQRTCVRFLDVEVLLVIVPL